MIIKSWIIVRLGHHFVQGHGFTAFVKTRSVESEGVFIEVVFQVIINDFE